MEGSHEALPVFGNFMTKVYKDKELSITKGKFPPPTVKITKNYYCPTPWDKKILLILPVMMMWWLTAARLR